MLPPNNVAQTFRATDIAEISGLKELWAETLGDPRICIAILDGPVDQFHTSLTGASLIRIETVVPSGVGQGPASQHGTHITSVIFGQHDGPIKGIAPRCRGLILPVFKDTGDGSVAPCSQLDLARAIAQAAQGGAHIINISGGEFATSGAAHPLLANTVRDCAAHGILIVAAVGNEGCDCLHIPGALPSVLAVGAMDSQGLPLGFSNWGERYQTQGILAPGENIPGADPGGGIAINSSTSYATPIVSGIAALLLSLQLKHGQKPDPYGVRSAILNSALGCDNQPAPDCRRLLAGRLNIKGAISQLIQGVGIMPNLSEIQDNTQEKTQSPLPEDTGLKTSSPRSSTLDIQAPVVTGNSPEVSGDPSQLLTASDPKSYGNSGLMHQGMENNPRSPKTAACECSCGSGAPMQLVFALGKLGYDFGTEARRDSIMQHMDPSANNPNDPEQLLAYLETNPWDASAFYWTLNLDATPLYAIQAKYAFAEDIYRRLREFLGEQTRGEVERVSIPGHIAGNVKLLTGQIVPVIWPDLRGMYSWNTKNLVEAVCKDKETYDKCEENVANFLLRIYEELRNLGITSQERAINYAATNALLAAEVFEDAIKREMELDTIGVECSPICRTNSDCWDIKLTFFNPSRVFEQARRVYLITVDVSDVVPVMVGKVRSWFFR